MDPEIGEKITTTNVKRARRYCFTLNNYTSIEYDAICTWMEDITHYSLVGKEVGASGTPHLQGYMNFKNARTVSSVRSLSGLARAAIFYCRGTETQNIKYCKKEGDFKEYHSENANIKEISTLDAQAKLISSEGVKGLKTIIQENPKAYVMHHRGFHALLTACAPNRKLDAPPKFVYAIGDAGSGKSTYIHKLAEEEAAATGKSIYYFGAQWPWADGYTDEEIIVIDDIRDRDFKGVPIPVNFMTRMIDVFSCTLQTKGGTCKFYGSSFYLSSVVHPGDMWNKDVNDPNTQILRRITDLYHCKKQAGIYSCVRLGDGLAPRVGFIPPP